MYVAFQIPTAEGLRGHFSQCQSLIYFGDFILIRRRCHNFHRLTRWWLVWRQLVIRLPIVVQLLNYRSMSTSITVPLQTRTQRVISIWAILRIHQRLFNVEISFASNSFIIKDNFIKVCIIRKLVKFNIKLSLFQPQWEIDKKVIITLM